MLLSVVLDQAKMKYLVKELGDGMDVNFDGIRMGTTGFGYGQSDGTQLLWVSLTSDKRCKLLKKC